MRMGSEKNPHALTASFSKAKMQEILQNLFMECKAC
jgi:hypothetical protein